MPRAALAAFVLVLAGCAVVERAPPPRAVDPHDLPPGLAVDAGWRSNLAAASLYAAMAYGAREDQAMLERAGGDAIRARMPGLDIERRLELLASRGLHGAYVAPSLWIMPWIHHPELYVVGDARRRSLTLIFVGSNDAGDWYQNLKPDAVEDAGRPGEYYIPTGHAGFRRGVLNLVGIGFFDRVLPQLASSWNIPAGTDGRIDLFVVGHSLGAAEALLCMPALDGWRHAGGVADDGGFRLERMPGPWAVRGAFLIAPPYALSSDEFLDPRLDAGRWRRDAAGYAWMTRHYGHLVWNAIHDADPVSRLYDPRNIHEVSMKHLGRLVRIRGDGSLHIEESPAWGNLRPHDPWTYWRALRDEP
jgi:hypothetical protein